MSSTPAYRMCQVKKKNGDVPSQSKGHSNEYLTKLFAGCLCFAEILGPVLGHEPPLQAGQATVLSDHTSQTNWTFGVKYALT